MAFQKKCFSIFSLWAGFVLLAWVGFVPTKVFSQGATNQVEPKSNLGSKPSLTVTLTSPKPQRVSQQYLAFGPLAPWQEIILAAETGGLRIQSVNVVPGDFVKSGQVLATLSSQSIDLDVAQARAQLTEAEAIHAEAQANMELLQKSQSWLKTNQEIIAATAAEKISRAKLDQAIANFESQKLRLAHTRIIAVDDGMISSSAAIVGNLVQQGEELFRLTRKGRLEWRAEVSPNELSKLRQGMIVAVTVPGVATAKGQLRLIAPTINSASHMASVYVDLPINAIDQGFRAGMFARGEFQLGESTRPVIPMSAVVMRNESAHVFRITALKDGYARVALTKIELGQRYGDMIVLLSGVSTNQQIVQSGGGFLADGDVVKVISK